MGHVMQLFPFCRTTYLSQDAWMVPEQQALGDSCLGWHFSLYESINGDLREVRYAFDQACIYTLS